MHPFSDSYPSADPAAVTTSSSTSSSASDPAAPVPAAVPASSPASISADATTTPASSPEDAHDEAHTDATPAPPAHELVGHLVTYEYEVPAADRRVTRYGIVLEAVDETHAHVLWFEADSVLEAAELTRLSHDEA